MDLVGRAEAHIDHQRARAFVEELADLIRQAIHRGQHDDLALVHGTWKTMPENGHDETRYLLAVALVELAHRAPR
jgi:hypothetical protein